MEAIRVAQTFIDLNKFTDRSGYVPHSSVGEEPDELAEMAGRLCYKSWSRPNPVTAKNDDYIANIIRQQHFSVLEHASVTYYVRGVSRNLLLELERHRHLSFSVVSQRYVDQVPNTGIDYVNPPAFSELSVSDQSAMNDELEYIFNEAELAYKYIYDFLIERGYKNKEAREAARAALPSSTATEFLVTGNLRTWREILQKRLSPTADKEIQQLAKLILRDLKEYAPATFQDFKEEE